MTAAISERRQPLLLFHAPARAHPKVAAQDGGGRFSRVMAWARQDGGGLKCGRVGQLRVVGLIRPLGGSGVPVDRRETGGGSRIERCAECRCAQEAAAPEVVAGLWSAMQEGRRARERSTTTEGGAQASPVLCGDSDSAAANFSSSHSLASASSQCVAGRRANEMRGGVGRERRRVCKATHVRTRRLGGYAWREPWERGGETLQRARSAHSDFGTIASHATTMAEANAERVVG